MRRSRASSVVASVVIFVIAWELAVIVTGLPPYILPPPEAVTLRFVRAWAEGTFTPHVVETVIEVLLGYSAGSIAGLLAGYATARSGIIDWIVSPYLVAAQATPILALAPLFVVWFGPGLLSKVVICTLIVFFPIAVSAAVGFRSADPTLREMAVGFLATRRQLLTAIEIPCALPSVFGGLRVGATLAVVGAIVSEWAGAQQGLGVLVNIARGSLYDTPLLFATLVMIAMLGIVLYALVTLVEHLVGFNRRG